MLTQEVLWRAAEAIGWFGVHQGFKHLPEGRKHLEAIAEVLRWAITGGSFLAMILGKMEKDPETPSDALAFVRSLVHPEMEFVEEQKPNKNDNVGA